MQIVKNPAILPCAICNAKARLELDWEQETTYQIYSPCHCNNTMIGYNIETNRAICKWNNKQILITKLLNNEKVEVRVRNNQLTPFMKRMFKLLKPTEK
jgi:hypothetical protein